MSSTQRLKNQGGPGGPVLPTLVEVERLLAQGCQQRLYSAAVCVAARNGRFIHTSAAGSPQMPPPARRLSIEALFDLGNITASLATSVGIVYLAGKGRIDLEMPLSRVLPEAVGTPLANIAVDSLLDHTSGLAAPPDLVAPLVEADRRRTGSDRVVGTPQARAELWAQMVAHLRPGTEAPQAVYCAYNALLLGWVIEALVHKPLHVWLQQEIYKPLGIDRGLAFRPYPQADARIKPPLVATLTCPLRRRLLWGEVADPVAYALGGAPGHAGLFGNAAGVFRVAEALRMAYQGKHPLLHAGTLTRLWTRLRRTGEVPLTPGWESMTRHSSLGQGRWHPTAVGQVDVAMGTAYLVDPVHGHVCVLLTNASHAPPQAHSKGWLPLCRRVFDVLATTT